MSSPTRRPPKTLERVLSKAGYGSRTEARQWIAAGRVAVGGRVVLDPDAWIDPGRDLVELDGRPLERAAKVYLLLNKPTGYLTTYDDPAGRPTVYGLLPPGTPWVFPAGRLDLDTSGLLVLTNDAVFAERLTDPAHQVPKTYRVKASRFLSDAELARLAGGVALADGPTRPAAVARLRNPGGRTVFEIVLREGRNRQVRRMVEALGAKVTTLQRVAIGAIAIGELPLGETRALSAAEIRELGGRPPRATGSAPSAAPAAAPGPPAARPGPPPAAAKRRPAAARRAR